MFKKGDIVVCIDDSDINTHGQYNKLKKHSTYIIKKYDEYFDSVFLINMRGIYISKRFISIKKYRKLKLEKLNNVR